jgi:hypothetical protein
MSRRNLESVSSKASRLRRPDSGRPTTCADVAGATYAASVPVDHRKNLGIYLTPVSVADFMASQIRAVGDTIRILDPAAGAGVLLCAAVESLVARTSAPRRIDLVAYEVDAALAKVLAEVLKVLQGWAEDRGTVVAVQVVRGDFILEHAVSLRSMGGFFPHLAPKHAFDVRGDCEPALFQIEQGRPSRPSGSFCRPWPA